MSATGESIASGAPPELSAGRARLGAAAWFLAYLALAAFVQLWLTPVPHDADTAYHVAVGRLIREHGILQAFPWTPFSWLADHYADKELLFHLALAPLAALDWKVAAHVVGALAEAALLAALHLVLRRERVRFAGAWALLPLLASSAFAFRFALVRPHLLSIALALVVTWAAARGRLAILAAASAVYPWAYVAWQLPLLLVVLVEGARLTSGARPGWKPLAVAAASIAGGVLVHPNAANLVRLSWIQLVDVLVQGAWGGRAGIELGDEFRPFTLGEWAMLLGPAVLLAGAALWLAWRRRREDAGPLGLAFAAAAFGLLTLRTARFAEYLVPFSVAAFAVAAAARARRPAWLLAGMAAACAAWTGAETVGLAARLRTWPDPLPAADAEVLARRIPAGAQVFTCEWGLTGRLMLALPDRRFVVALDPTFFARRDPELYALWYRLPREAPPGLAATIRERFGASHVACFWDERFRPFFDRIAFEPGVDVLLVGESWNAYELRGR